MKTVLVVLALVLAAESRSDDANLSLLVANVMIDNRESEAFLDVVREYDPDVILTVETDDWWDEALRSLEEDYPHTLKNPLDHVFHSDHFKLVRMETGPAWGSDHFPVFIELSLEAGAESEQEEPNTSRAEEEQVAEKIEDGREKKDE